MGKIVQYFAIEKGQKEGSQEIMGCSWDCKVWEAGGLDTHPSPIPPPYFVK